jgi:hypothetical protein
MTIKTKRKKKFIDRMSKYIVRDVKTAVARSTTQVMHSIKARVKDNVSHTGTPFKDYTPAYKKHKESKGLKERFVYSGKMMGQMVWRGHKDGLGSRIFFKGLGDTKAARNTFDYGRDFLRVNRIENNFLRREVLKVIRKYTK